MVTYVVRPAGSLAPIRIRYRARMPVAVVTDSTAYLPAELSGAYDLTVVPLTVVVNGVEGLEGIEIIPGRGRPGARRAPGRR